MYLFLTKNGIFMLLVCTLSYTGIGVTLELKSYSACYGITGLDNFLQPSCPGTQKIAVRAVYTLSKYKSSGCPQQQTGAINATCCQYDVNDCAYLYDSGSYRTYYQTCNGKSSCLIQVSWIDLPSNCDASLYIERTHYMKMDYYCVSDQAVDPCSDLTTTDSPAFFWNTGYPSEMTSASTSCTCSVELSCNTTVQITALDLNLKDVGSCQQSLVITDGGSSRALDCTSNNDLLPKVIYTSSGYFITVNFVNNLGTNGGKFFIQIEGLNPTGQITLSCGASALSVPSASPSSLTSCPIEGALTSTVSTTQFSSLSDSTSSTEGGLNSTVSTTQSTSPANSTSTEGGLTSTTQSANLTNSTSSTEVSTSSSLSAESSTYSSTENSTETSTEISSTLTTNDETRSTENSNLTSGEFDVNATLYGNVTLFSTDSTIELNVSTLNTSDMTPEFTTLSWTSTEDYLTAGNNDVTSKPSDPTPIYVIPVVILVVIFAVVTLLLFYKDRIKECCCGKKEVKGDVEDIDADEVNPIFQVDLTDHSKFQALPPLRHDFKLKTNDLDNPKAITREHALFLRAKERHQNRTLLRLSGASRENDTNETMRNENKTKKKLNRANIDRSTLDQTRVGVTIPEAKRTQKDSVQTRGGTSEGRKKKHKKTKFQKGIGRGKVAQKDEHPTPEFENTSVQNSTLPFTSLSSSRRSSFHATIDISDNEGHLERSVLIDGVMDNTAKE